MGEKYSFEVVEQNLKTIRDNVKKAAERAGRKETDVKILAATKTVDVDTINFAISKGLRYIGENRVQELLEKYDKLDLSNTELHFIGRLQTNKVKYIIDKVSLIHSVDSLKLATEIDRMAKKHDKMMDILIEINAADEETKGGVKYDEVCALAEQISLLGNVRVKGLMTIPPKVIFPESVDLEDANSTNIGANERSLEKIYKNQEFFKKIMNLFLDISTKKLDNIDMYELSYGMSDDYVEAVECGSTIIRPGRAIFGDRIY